MNNIKPFKFYCQKVLPLVYSDALSYYETVCKLVDKINELIATDNEQTEAIEQLQSDVLSITRDLANLNNYADKILHNFAGDYIDSVQYNPGEYVVHDGYLWICIDQATGEWDDSKWLQARISDAVAANTDRSQNNLIKINKLAADIVDAYDSTHTYYLGDYCIFNYQLYRCKGTTTGDFDSTWWEKATVTDEISDISSKVNNNLATEFSPFSSYLTGDYVWYQNILYQARNDVSAGAFNSSDWETVEVTTKIKELGEYDQKILHNIAGDYIDSVQYNPGEYVVHNGYLWVCIDQATGEWDDSKWLQARVSDAVTANTDRSQNNLTKINKLAANIVEPYDPTHTYNTGAYTIYNYQLYRCMQSTTGDFDISSWMPAYICGELNVHFNIITNMSSAISGISDELIRSNYFIGVNNNSMKYDSTKSYTTGDLCYNTPTGEEPEQFQEYKIYQCVANTTGTWDISNWTQVDIISLLQSIINP